MTDRNTTLIVDGSNLVMRGIKAGHSLDLSSHGVDTSGLLIFVNLLSKYVRQVEPHRLVVCFDQGRSSRVEIDPRYKEDRPQAEPHEKDTFGLARKFLDLAGIANVSLPTREADDLIAGYVHANRDFPDNIIILSGDKDFLQLLAKRAGKEGASVSQIRPGLNPEEWTEDTVIAKMGCSPWHLAKAMALSGDKSDGVRGVPKVGLKTAIKILRESQWIWEYVLQHRLVGGHEEQVQNNLQMIRLGEGGWTEDELLQVNFFKIPVFLPESYSPDLLAWLRDLDMSNLVGRIISNRLWRGENLGLRLPLNIDPR